MLKSLFLWLDHYPNSYWIIAAGPTLLLTGWIGRAAGQGERGAGKAGWRDALVLFLFLFAWRWPFLLVADEFNPDESQLISGAITLTHDPVFWRSVDGTTSGPLNFYALLPMHWLGLPLDYFSARLTGLLLIAGALFLCLRTLACSFGRAPAWLGVLPAAAFFATVSHSDLVHYSSEHLSLLFLAAACWLLAGRKPDARARLWAACAISGAAPWAKLQTAPLVLVLIGWALCQELRGRGVPIRQNLRRIAMIGIAAITPTLLATVMIAATGQLENAVRRYFLHNLIYVSQNHDRTIAEAMRMMKDMALHDGRFPLLLVSTLVLLCAATLFFLKRRVRPPALFAVGGSLTLAATFAILTPHREFLHYTLLLSVPLTLWLGAALGGWWTQLSSVHSRRLLAIALFSIGGLLPVVTRCRQAVPDIYGNFSQHWRHPRSPVAEVIHALAGREGSLGVWGWSNQLYVETGLPQATRDAHSVWSILPNPQRDYHRATYLADLRRHQPAVFVDTVGDGAFAFANRHSQAHEIFPELADYVAKNYVLVRDVRNARIYVRKDRAGLEDLLPQHIDQLLARGRSQDGKNTIPPAITTLDQLPRKQLGSGTVMMLLPPTLVEWKLDQEVREVTFGFGFDPEAYERGASNGADVILELASLGQARQVYYRRLDPAHTPQDRGLQTARVTLPPFAPGTHLLLRTDPGPFGDTAWDWVYLASLQFRRSPFFLPEQFPGFNRVPDYADAELSSLSAEADGPILYLDAPASLIYVLRGGERQLRFNYGFRPGAYSDGGHTDGAVFRVVLQSSGQSARLLFERHLKPGHNPADRRTQLLDLALPTVQPGDRLTLSIDPGPTGDGSWDWTEIHHLTLR